MMFHHLLMVLRLHHGDRLTQQLAVWRDELRAVDRARRLQALRAIGEYVDALIHEEYARPQAHITEAPPPLRVRALRRLMAHLTHQPRSRRPS